MSGLASLLWVGLRTRWGAVVLLPTVIATMLVAVAAAITDLYRTAEERIAYARTVGEFTPSIALNGRGYDLTTPGGIVSEELGILALLVLPAVGIHLAVSLTRAVEDSGRLELLTAGRVSRSAPAVSGMLLGLVAVLVLCIALTAGLLMIDLPLAGSLRYAAALGGLTAAHMGIGWVTAQVSRDARTAYGAALAVALGIFLVRLVVDVRGWDATGVSPSGWAAEARPWGDDPRVWPHVAYTTMVALSMATTWMIAARRDLGDGILAPRPGPAGAGILLHGPWQLAWRLIRPGATGWLIGITVFSFGFGLVAEEMSEIMDHNPQLADAIGSGLEAMTALALLLVSLGAAAAGLQSIGVLIGEETTGRTGLVLAAPISRLRWWAGLVVLAGTQVIATMLAGTTGLAASMALVLEDNGWWATCFTATAALAPPALGVVGVAVAAGALTPAGRQVGWILLAWSFVATVFDELLDLPRWAAALSPWHWVGRVPVETADWWAVGSIVGLVFAAVALSVTVFSRRELVAG